MPQATHAYVHNPTTVPDGADTTVVRPSDWSQVHITDALLLQINQLVISSTSTVTLPRQTRLVLTDNTAGVDQVIVGTPQLPSPNEVVPSDYVHNIGTGRLTLQGATRRMSVLGSGRLQVFDEVGEAKFLAPDRDVAYPRGHPVAGATNYYYLPGVPVNGIATWTFDGSGVIMYYPHYLEAPVVLDQVAAEVTTLSAATNFRIGLYVSDARWQPVGAPLFDSGSLSSATTGVKTFTPAAPISLARGRYLMAVQADNGAAALRAFSASTVPSAYLSTLGGTPAIQEISVNGTYGALPTPGTPWNTVNNGGTGTPFKYLVVWRTSSP